MNKFKIVFLDDKEIEVEAVNFSSAYVLAAYSWVKAGNASALQLLINGKASSMVAPAKEKKWRNKK